MKPHIQYFFFIILFSSCFLMTPWEPSEEEKKEAFEKASYDTKIINDFPKYNALAQLILNNLDTIINYKNSTNFIITVDSSGIQSKVLSKDDCFAFFDGNELYDIKTMPPFLASAIDTLWASVDKTQMLICKKERPALLSMYIKYKDRENNIMESHCLYWHLSNLNNNDSFDLLKDTSLSKDCIYRVGIAKDDSGW